MVRTGDSQSLNVGFKPRIRYYVAPSNKRIVHQPFKLKMLGSIPTGAIVIVV